MAEGETDTLNLLSSQAYWHLMTDLLWEPPLKFGYYEANRGNSESNRGSLLSDFHDFCTQVLIPLTSYLHETS